MEFDSYFKGDLDQDWEGCFTLWKPVGYIKGLRHHIRKPSHLPSFEERLGGEFAYRYYNDWEGIVPRLESKDEVEAVCAFDMLENMLREFLDDMVDPPTDMLAIDTLIPKKIAPELQHCLDPFTGSTVGEWLSFAKAEGYI